MTVSVQESVVRCFEKFGDKPDARATAARMKWRNPSPARPAAARAGKGERLAPPA